MRWTLILAVALGLCGCKHIARKTGVAGWFTVDDAPALEYPQRFAPIDLASLDCPTLHQRLAPGGLIVVMVHGVKGDGTEWLEPLKDYPSLPPHVLLMYRWVPWSDRDAIVQGLANGLNHLARCLADRHPRLVVLGHSAGGVAVAFAAQYVSPPSEVETWLITVASPLAGSNARRRNEQDRQEAVFMLDLGSGIQGYAAAPASVHVLHLRTNPKTDTVMEPGRDGHQPNDPKVGVAGALQVDLPEDLGHDGSLGWVVKRLVDAGGDPKAAKW